MNWKDIAPPRAILGLILIYGAMLMFWFGAAANLITATAVATLAAMPIVIGVTLVVDS